MTWEIGTRSSRCIIVGLRAAKCKTTAELEQWLFDWSELDAALDEDGAERYITLMTCHTDNAEAEAAYLHLVEKIQPLLKAREFALARIFIEHPLRAQLPKARYEVFDRNTELQGKLFRPEIVPQETEEAKLSQQYQKLAGSLTVKYAGEEKTLIQMGRYLEEPDRQVRQETWELVAKRRLQEAEKMEDIFDALLKVREEIGRNAGFRVTSITRSASRGALITRRRTACGSMMRWKKKSCRWCVNCRQSGENGWALPRCGRGIWPWIL